MTTAIAIAHPNIALIKYWGNRDHALRLPMNGSISMNLEELFTRVSVTWQKKTKFQKDSLTINGIQQEGKTLNRVSIFLDNIRLMASFNLVADVISETNIPSGTGIASSAAAFAALSLAASQSAGLNLDPIALSCLARRGSGSACRSIPAGFTEWNVGDSDQTSYAVSFAPPDHWDLVDVIAIISREHKSTGSSQGHILAASSPLQNARVEDTPRRLALCREAIQKRDFDSLAEVVEADSNLLHAIMITSSPPLFYWQGASLSVFQKVRAAREQGLHACYTVDAGANVHVICLRESLDETRDLIKSIEGVGSIMVSQAGGPTRLATVE